MFTFEFFAKLCFSGWLSTMVLSFCEDVFIFEENLATKIAYRVSTILYFIACGCIVISIFGMIWTA